MFFKLKTTGEVFQILQGFDALGQESLPLADTLGRTLARDIVSPEDLPGFPRSSMDGYALRSRDTFGATENLPALVEMIGEVTMGRIPDAKAGEGKAVRIPTGGMLPQGADAVVMLEHCNLLDEGTVEVSRAISPGENVIRADDDFKKGAMVLPKGHFLRPQDLGALAGLGYESVPVHKRPKVAILSTGDEVIPIHQKPLPGQVRDINSTTLSAFCRQKGAEPVLLGLCDDNFKDMKKMIDEGIQQADAVWISGGSSVGTRDLTLKVFESFDEMEVLVHGISISPGKPTIIARIGPTAIFGLPGHTVSAMVVAEVFLTPFISILSGRSGAEGQHALVEARLSRNIESAGGREDYIRVRLMKEGDDLIADPIFGKSGLISTLVEADGLLRIDMNTEGLYQDQRVKVMKLN
ncbi:MAG: gephyrin-like molybdotransferase Glp [Pseudomonadota bacterium]